MLSKIGFYTGLCWSASFLFAMLSLRQPALGFAGNLIGVASIWVAGWQLRAMQMNDVKEAWGVRSRWHKSLQTQLLAALVCTFVQYAYFQFFDNGAMMQALTEIYTNPINAEALKQMLPEYEPQQVLDMLSTISLKDIVINMLVMNAFLAIILSLPTTVVAKWRKP